MSLLYILNCLVNTMYKQEDKNMFERIDIKIEDNLTNIQKEKILDFQRSKTGVMFSVDRFKHFLATHLDYALIEKGRRIISKLNEEMVNNEVFVIVYENQSSELTIAYTDINLEVTGLFSVMEKDQTEVIMGYPKRIYRDLSVKSMGISE